MSMCSFLDMLPEIGRSKNVSHNIKSKSKTVECNNNLQLDHPRTHTHTNTHSLIVCRQFWDMIKQTDVQGQSYIDGFYYEIHFEYFINKSLHRLSG